MRKTRGSYLIFGFLSEEVAPFAPVLLFLIIECRFREKGERGREHTERWKMKTMGGRGGCGEETKKKKKPPGNIMFSCC